MKPRALIVCSLFVLLAGCGGTQPDQDSRSHGTTQASSDAPANTEETTVSSGDAPAEAEETTVEPSGLPTVAIEASGGKQVEVRVEISDGLLEQARGLMYRKTLGENRGMLFVYPDERELSFWMKNTRIPLSIAYIDSKGRITDVLDMKPFDDRPPHYVSSKPVKYALEVNKGFFKERGVKVGDHAKLPG